jgi:hypothetical protein
MTASHEEPPPRPPGPPSPYGAFAIVEAFGMVAAPLLAGVAVTLMALVAQSAIPPRWPDLALVLLGLAATLFLYVIQLNARARGYAVTPSQVREWYPDDYTDPHRQRVLAWELHHHRDNWAYLVRRARFCNNLAIIALLAGIATVLVPRPAGEFTPLRWVAILVIVGAIVFELIELADQRLRRRPSRGFVAVAQGFTRRVAPSDPPVDPPPFG